MKEINRLKIYGYFNICKKVLDKIQYALIIKTVCILGIKDSFVNLMSIYKTYI